MSFSPHGIIVLFHNQFSEVLEPSPVTWAEILCEAATVSPQPELCNCFLLYIFQQGQYLLLLAILKASTLPKDSWFMDTPFPWLPN